MNLCMNLCMKGWMWHVVKSATKKVADNFTFYFLIQCVFCLRCNVMFSQMPLLLPQLLDVGALTHLNLLVCRHESSPTWKTFKVSVSVAWNTCFSTSRFSIISCSFVFCTLLVETLKYNLIICCICWVCEHTSCKRQTCHCLPKIKYDLV